jgi:hypothetical protein
MDPQQLEDLSNEIQAWHRSIKNVIEIVFAISPLLALSTQGWATKSINSVYLLRVSLILVVFSFLLTIKKIFNALGNDRPQILVRMEDCVLEGIIAISEGKPREEAMHTLHSEISSLMKDLAQDEDALSWFSLSTDASVVLPTSPPSEFPSTPSSSEFI